jgi:membrane-bound hydrogenase subunit mbhJ
VERTRPSRRSSVWVLPLDSSGCGACTQQIYALQAPRYAQELRAHGIQWARSPRHADVVLVTGALSQAAREPLRRVLAGVPQPRALVAVGNCAINGCVFHGSAEVISDGAEELDVNVEIAGCPPSPQAILEAIAEASQLLAAESVWTASTDPARDADSDPDPDQEAQGSEAADGDQEHGGMR